ncbi:DUF7263 family protein [Haladaptatus caseinilyticus]|uniref:DUF7263 family protein n=1 Tax=Haladaptatus caseinilyticus TaxID=2993314 RepID=UPI00224A77F0|nr:hypothetical protein [Haladaptatus caseinilyticus]
MTGCRTNLRGQMNLPALAVALLILTMVTGLSVGMADRAFLSSKRDATARQVGVAVSERMVSDESPVTVRSNVLVAAELDRLDEKRMKVLFPAIGTHDVRIGLNDATLAERGDPTGGPTIRRVVLVERRERVTRTPRLSPGSPRFTLPRRTSNATLVVQPPAGTTVSAIRANGRIVLRNESGLNGTFSVSLSRFETTRFAFETEGSGSTLPTGSVRVTYYPTTTRKAVLAVMVDE